ncbi:ABC transporter ATP-binding protein [Oceanobacillus piezotolerans]|uniref:ABC transporter ATP-binding protein n=1 Tax=Oceanobacillus piezotolerans TaxID=2448030 RepID=A0A498DG40_9BACI|nr:ABC transporter ATP-binding protein [Oceanobacillus piezotolerans]RLL43592.1 ABC transporter ATP-binding protein [Oceanobacillus piezotolerans]
MKPFVDVQNLTIRYETRQENALSSVSFQLKFGESLLLLGPSGSGKSTLTSCLNGLFPRELDGEMHGKIFVDGRENRDLLPGERSRKVGVVFQDPETQFCMLTVEDEVAFGLENLGIPNEEMELKIDAALTLVNMLSFKKASISSLSGGQKQKLALACILALEPALLIIDEPTANLDAIATKEFIETIKALRDKVTFSLIVIEHKLDGWTDITERCVLLNRQGEIFYDGSIRQALREQRQQLTREGIWIPRVTQFVLEQHPLLSNPPLTIEEFRENPLPIKEERIADHVSISSKPLVQARHLSWSAGNKEIVKDVSLTFHKGEFVAIVGANGSGKTSLSRILAGIRQPTNGSLLVKGKSLSKWKEAQLRQEIGYVFQNPEHQFITNTVYDEVAFGLKWKDTETIEIEKIVNDILESFGLLELKNEHPFSLSQGQKRRLSVATMIVDDQSFLLLDEPTFGQDSHTNTELMGLLKQRHQTGATIVMITHDMDIVADYATRVIVIGDGAVLADCSPHELWKMPIDKLMYWKLELPISVQLKKIYEGAASYVSTTT